LTKYIVYDKLADERGEDTMKHETIKALRNGETLNFNGISLLLDEGIIQPGDLYIAESNTGPKLLTAKKVVMTENGLCINYIHATTPDYSFDGCACVKVREA